MTKEQDRTAHLKEIVIDTLWRFLLSFVIAAIALLITVLSVGESKANDVMLSPAYAEVNCRTSAYTGLRYRYANEAFEPIDRLWTGRVWYKGTYPINTKEYDVSAEYIPQSKTRCIYS